MVTSHVLKGSMQSTIRRYNECAVPSISAVATRIGGVSLKTLQENSAYASLAALLLWCLRSEASAIGNGAFLCSHIIIVNFACTIIGEAEPAERRPSVTDRILNFEVRHLLVLAVYFRVWSNFPWFAAWLISAARLLLTMHRCGCKLDMFYTRSVVSACKSVELSDSMSAASSDDIVSASSSSSTSVDLLSRNGSNDCNPGDGENPGMEDTPSPNPSQSGAISSPPRPPKRATREIEVSSTYRSHKD